MEGMTLAVVPLVNCSGGDGGYWMSSVVVTAACRSRTGDAIQALDRTQPALPLRPGQPERHSVEYVRHGTVSLFAALEVHTGKVKGRCAARHTSEEFVGFLDEAVVGRQRRQIHLILDNLAVHKTPWVQTWLNSRPNVHLHFTPTYASWLNQVEIWYDHAGLPPSRHLSLGTRPGSQDHDLHPAVQP